MSEMVDRVAKALMDQSDGWTVFYEGEMTARAMARAAIAAMSEATPEMLAAVIERPDALIAERTAQGVTEYAARMDAAVAAERLALAQRWRAMIDEALKGD